MDKTKPIDIQAVNQARIDHGDLLQGLNMLSVMSILQDCMPSLGIQNSRELGKTEHGSISSKYLGVFVGDKTIGKIVPREIKVYPIVAEMADEPERYRETYIAEVAGNMWEKKHPFELWILQYGINIASEDLHNVIFIAKRDSDPNKKSIKDSFDGWSTIIAKDIASGLISAEKKNLFAPGEGVTRANAGDYMLEMWQQMHPTFKEKDALMWIPSDVADLYDGWYRDEHDNPPNVDQSGQEFLEGTQKKCRIKRHNAMPAGAQEIILTRRQNMIYGTDKLEDMKAMKAFESGNPYAFTAAMKYVFGTQFTSIHPREFCVNDRSAVGSGSASV